MLVLGVPSCCLSATACYMGSGLPISVYIRFSLDALCLEPLRRAWVFSQDQPAFLNFIGGAWTFDPLSVCLFHLFLV